MQVDEESSEESEEEVRAYLILIVLEFTQSIARRVLLSRLAGTSGGSEAYSRVFFAQVGFSLVDPSQVLTTSFLHLSFSELKNESNSSAQTAECLLVGLSIFARRYLRKSRCVSPT